MTVSLAMGRDVGTLLQDLVRLSSTVAREPWRPVLAPFLAGQDTSFQVVLTSGYAGVSSYPLMGVS